MARIVLVHDGIASKLITVSELCSRLRDAGHELTLVSHIEQPAATAGFAYRRHALKFTGWSDRPRLRADWLRRMPSARKRRSAMVDGFDTEGFRDTVRELAPALLLIDIECQEFVIAGAATGVPIALFNVFFNLWFHPGVPPLHLDTVPGRGLRGSRPGVRWSWIMLRAWKFRQRWREYIAHAGVDRLSVLQDFARSIGYPLASHTDRWQWLIPFVFRGLPVLTLNPMELEFPHQPDEQVRYVGPVIRAARPADTETGNSALHALLQQHRRAKGARTLVYCAFGAMMGAPGLDLWRTLVEVARARSSWDLVFGLGAKIQPQQLGNLPANVHALAWAPQVPILEQADCAVIHAGMTSVYECIHARVPMLLYPFNTNDQLGTAARVCYHGLGSVGERAGDDAPAICVRIEALLGDDGLRERMDAMQRRIDRYRRRNVAVAAVEALIAAPR